jgi:hypothetical protein
MYRAYYGAGKCGPVPPMEKDRWPSKEFANLDEALLWARAVVKHGTAVLAIEGDDGTQLSRGEIAGHVRLTLPADS